MSSWKPSLPLLFALLAFCAAASGQSPGPAHNPTDQLRARALQAVQAERARAQQPVCPNVAVTLEVNECDSAELDKTNQNYLKLTRALGALLRERVDKQSAVTRIPFDDAESTWATYRDQQCTVAGSVFEGGTIRPSVELLCKITLTRHHMDGLWAVYHDLGTN